MYGFDSGLDLQPVSPGTSVVITGPAMSGLTELTLRLLACGDREGLIVLSTDDPADEVIANYERRDGRFDHGRMAVVDCGKARETTSEDGNVRSVTSPTDLTGLGIQFTSLYEELYRGGIDAVRVGVLSVSSLLLYAKEFRNVYRFLHTMTGRIRSADGLGVFALDPSSHDDRAVQSIVQTFDARIELRETDGGREFRVRGLAEQPEDWRSYEPVAPG